jgi:hypothetical protein
MRSLLIGGGSAATLNEMLSFAPSTLPGGVSLDRVSARAPWRGYVLRATVSEPTSGDHLENGPGRRSRVEVPVAAGWNRSFLLGTLSFAAAVVIGLSLPSAAHSRSYGFIAAGCAIAGLAFLTRARFVLAAPNALSVAHAVAHVRAAHPVAAEQLDQRLGHYGGPEAARAALLELAHVGRDDEPVRGGRDRSNLQHSHGGGTSMTLTDVTWRAQVEARARDLEADLQRARAAALTSGDVPTGLLDFEIAAQNIALARNVAAATPRALTWAWLRQWSSGSDIETAWSALHQAEAALTVVLPPETTLARLPDLRANLNSALGGDPRLAEYLKTLDQIQPSDPKSLTDQDRQTIRAITDVATAISDAAHSNIRNYRNWLLIVSGVVSGALIAVAVAHAADSNFLLIKSARSASGAGADVGEIEVAGAIGGLLMALFALIRLTIYSGPVALPLWQALVRIPAGAAAGLVGSLLLQGELVSAIVPQGRSGLLGYAVLFGAAPELILRFLDEKVNEATAAARPKDPAQPSTGAKAETGRKRVPASER